MSCVSCIIVNWNGKPFLAECLEALRRQRYRSFETVVVDNGSDDGSVPFLESRYPEVRVVALPRNTGFAAANNLVMKTVRTPYVALLNNDAFPAPLWLENLVEALDRHPEAGFAASKMLFHDRPDIIDRAGDAYTRAGAALLRGRGMQAGECRDPGWVFGACAGAALYRMDMLNDIGMFDEDFFLLYEDVDLSFRAQLRGYRCLFVPEAVVYHKGSGSIRHDSPTSVYYGHRNLEWVYIKNMPARLILRSVLMHAIYDFASLAYFLLSGRGMDFLRAKKDALKGWKGALQKRRGIQEGKRVSDAYLWDLMEKEILHRRRFN